MCPIAFQPYAFCKETIRQIANTSTERKQNRIPASNLTKPHSNNTLQCEPRANDELPEQSSPSIYRVLNSLSSGRYDRRHNNTCWRTHISCTRVRFRFVKNSTIPGRSQSCLIRIAKQPSQPSPQLSCSPPPLSCRRHFPHKIAAPHPTPKKSPPKTFPSPRKRPQSPNIRRPSAARPSTTPPPPATCSSAKKITTRTKSPITASSMSPIRRMAQTPRPGPSPSSTTAVLAQPHCGWRW